MHHITGEMADAVLDAIDDGLAELLQTDKYTHAGEVACIEYWRLDERVVRRDFMLGDGENCHMDILTKSEVGLYLGTRRFDK